MLPPQSPYQVQQQKENRYNMRKNRIQNKKGLREIYLKRNKLGDIFAQGLQTCLKYDQYLKVVDVSNNKISQERLREVIKLSLTENSSLVAFDARGNPGCNEKSRKQIALCLLKNIEQMKKKNIEIREEWIKQECLTFKIPTRILEGLGIQRVNTTTSEGGFSPPRSPTAKTPAKSVVGGGGGVQNNNNTSTT